MSEWDELYSKEKSSFPWEYRNLDPDFERFIRTVPIVNEWIMDPGCGTGIQAVAIAAVGFRVVGTDISPTACKLLKKRTGQTGNTVYVAACDVIKPCFRSVFGLIVDRGCFQVIHPELRPFYVRVMKDLLVPGGKLILKIFSEHEIHSEEDTLHCVSKQELEALFTGIFIIDSITETEYYLDRIPEGSSFPRAWFGVFKKPFPIT